MYGWVICAKSWQLLGDQALTKGDQGSLAKGRRSRVETIEHQLPAAIQGRRFDHFVIGDLRIRLEQRREGQLGGGDRGLTLPLVFLECQELLLKGIGK